MDTFDNARAVLLKSALILVIAIGVVHVLVEGRDILIPIVIAGFVWFIINALAQVVSRVTVAGRRLPPAAATSIAVVLVGGALVVVANLALDSVRLLQVAAPLYKQRLDQLLLEFAAMTGVEDMATTTQIVSEIDINALATQLVSSAAVILFDALLILFYVVFLLYQQKYVGRKLALMFPNDSQHELVISLIERIQKDIQTYFSIVVLCAVLTGGLTYIVLALNDVELAFLWSVLVGLFSFIPTLGTAFGIGFPALIALLQFDTLTPFLIVLAILAPAQIIISNVVQPALMGQSLNLSPFFILVGLAVWATVWGITGAILAVPIMVAATIIFSRFPSTRPVAVFLSLDGEIR
jgi:predicted PurR-regulated permease PerM